MLEEQLAGPRLGMFIIRNDSLIFISAGAFSGFPLRLCHWLHNWDCCEGEKQDMDRDEGKPPELERAEKQPWVSTSQVLLLAQQGSIMRKLRLLPPLWGSTTTGGVSGCWSPTHARRPPTFWGPVSLFLQVGEGHLSLVLALCCCVIILFPSALSLKKTMLLQSHSMCVQGTETFSLFRKSTPQLRFLEEE